MVSTGYAEILCHLNIDQLDQKNVNVNAKYKSSQFIVFLI